MTTFDALESSVASSRPIELFRISIGTDTYRYTSSALPVTIGTDTYEPAAIARSGLQQSYGDSGRTVTITLPANNAFASRYIDIVPGQEATVDIFRYQRDEVPALATEVLLFQGTVQSVRFPGDATMAEITLQSVEASLNRNVPRFTYSGMCNHFLFDAGCGVSSAAHNHIGTVTAESNSVLTVSGLAATGLDFLGGFVKPTGESDYRLIIGQSGDQITVLLPFPESQVGGTVQAFAGCDHLVDGDCALVYDNVANFGGFPFVPNRNLFETGFDG